MTDYSERNAFIEALYDRWYDYICQQCYRFVNYEPIRSLLVEDCVQEAFIKAARHYAQLQSHPNAVGWIIKTSENQILNETRKLRVRRKTLSLDSGSAALPASPENEIETWLSKQTICTERKAHRRRNNKNRVINERIISFSIKYMIYVSNRKTDTAADSHGCIRSNV